MQLVATFSNLPSNLQEDSCNYKFTTPMLRNYTLNFYKSKRALARARAHDDSLFLCSSTYRELAERSLLYSFKRSGRENKTPVANRIMHSDLIVSDVPPLGVGALARA